jgi:hypothetical protein
MTPNEWIGYNYDQLATIAKNVNQGKGDHLDLLHYTIEQFLTHPKAQDLVDKGHSKWFITRILSTSAKSKTSGYWREYRNDNEGLDGVNLTLDEPYDRDKDTVLEWTLGVLEDLKHDTIENWYRATILELCLKQPKLNFSQLSREIGIPRTSLTNAYHEGIEIIKEKINEYGHDYPTFRNSLIEYLADQS